MATKQIVGGHADGEYLHAAELDNLRRAANGAGVLTHTITVTVAENDLDIVVPAFDYLAPDGAGGLTLVSYAGATLTRSAADPDDPANDALVGDASGNVTIRDGTATPETGDVEDAPMVTLASDEVLFAKIRRPAAQSVVTAADISPRAVDVSDNHALFRPNEALSTDADSGSTHTINLNSGPVHALTLTANCTLTFSNPVATGRVSSFTLILTQDGTGSRTVTWPSSVDWAAATAPTLTTTAAGVDILTFFTTDGGTTWYGFVAGQAMG